MEDKRAVHIPHASDADTWVDNVPTGFPEFLRCTGEQHSFLPATFDEDTEKLSRSDLIEPIHHH